MDAGTVTLVIYLAGLSHSWFELERMIPRATAPFAKAYPLAVQFSDKPTCLQVADREKSRGNHAWCQTPGAWFVADEETGELQLATEYFMIYFVPDACWEGNARGLPRRMMIGGTATSVGRCKTKSRPDKTFPGGLLATLCIKAPVWVVDWRHWRLVGSRIVYIDRTKRITGGG